MKTKTIAQYKALIVRFIGASWKKIEDLAIELEVPRTGKKYNNFDKAWMQLIDDGILIQCGNEIKFNL